MQTWYQSDDDCGAHNLLSVNTALKVTISKSNAGMKLQKKIEKPCTA